MKKISVVLCSIGIACALTACGDAMPELTEEENELITEYAVGLLLKYDKNHNSRLVDLTQYEEEQDNKKAQEEEPKEESGEEKADTAENDNEGIKEDYEGLSADNTEVIEQPAARSIEEFYGIEDFSFQYTGYELLDEYPQMPENEEDIFFAMQATAGTKLLVLKFNAVNNSGTEKELNMLSYGMKARISVNDESAKGALSTMLLNDLQTYKGTLGAGESTELVVIVEVPAETNVQSVSLQLRSDSDSTELVLQ